MTEEFSSREANESRTRSYIQVLGGRLAILGGAGKRPPHPRQELLEGSDAPQRVDDPRPTTFHAHDLEAEALQRDLGITERRRSRAGAAEDMLENWGIGQEKLSDKNLPAS